MTRPATLVSAMCFVLGIPATPQTSSRTVWTGVFTPGQAERGKAAYSAKCGGCHRGDLNGYQGVLTTRFLERWREDHLESFYTVMKSSMPREAPASLPDETYVDIVAFVLQENGFPPGSGELTVGALPNVRVEAKSGPAPLQTGSLVHVVGCLTERPGNDWALTRATEPIRTREPKNSTAAELKVQEAKPLGSQTFGLMDFFGYRQEAQKGHKVAAKGFLIRNPAGDRINLTALQATALTCEP